MGEAQIGSQGSSAKYRNLFDENYAFVRAYCTRRVGAQDAEDLTAEVFTVAWRRIDAVPVGEKALPWLYGVAYRVVSHYRHSMGRKRKLTLKVAGQARPIVAAPGDQVVAHAEYARVLEAATHLRTLDQEVLRLAVWEELSHNQIAHVLDCTAAAARQRFHRAKRSLLREYVRLGGTVPVTSVAPKAVAQEGGEL